MTTREDLDLAARKLAEGTAHLRCAVDAQSIASTALERAMKRAVKEGLTALPPGDLAVTEHRSAHRPGRPPKIGSDHDLQAFVMARIDRMTFVQIAEDVAHHFPHARRVGKSAIHAWWQRNKAQDTRSRNPNRSPGDPG